MADFGELADDSKAFEFKGGMFPLTVLRLYRNDLVATSRHLGEAVSRTSFFRGAPVVIDLQPIRDATAPDFAGLATSLRAHGLVPVGVRHGTPEQEEAATAAGLGVIPDRGHGGSDPSTQESADKHEEAPATLPAPPRVISKPVRSGQQVYAAATDLVILAPVNAGAEVLADGSIYVYGPLRGRALAGVMGQTAARILCQSLEAEMVSIAGTYRVMEQPDPAFRDRLVHIYLSGDRLMIEAVLG
jgi:septum site-determining protein MinC